MKTTLLFSALLLPLSVAAQTVSSPNGAISVSFSLADGGRPTYEMTYKGRPVVKPSHLGLELAKDKHATKGFAETSLMDGFTESHSEVSSFDETWKPVWGETATIRNHYNELLVSLSQDHTGRQMNIRFRVYDDGMGLRYEFPQQDSLVYFIVKEEHTQFAMTGDHTAWWLPGDYDTQEQETQESRLSEIRARFHDAVNWSNSSVANFSETGVQTSLQMKSQDGLYINIHEAALVNYPAMHLNLDDKHMVFESWLTPDATGNKAYVQVLVELYRRPAQRRYLQGGLEVRPSQRTPCGQYGEREALYRLRGQERPAGGARRGLEHRLGGLGQPLEVGRLRLRHALSRLRHPVSQRVRPLQGREAHDAPRDQFEHDQL